MDRFEAYMTFGSEFLQLIFLLLSKNIEIFLVWISLQVLKW